MLENKIIEIIRLCLSISTKASKIYAEMAALTDNAELKLFWQNMSSEENEHIKFWKELLLLADQNAVPLIFDDFERIRSELAAIDSNVDILCEEIKHPSEEIKHPMQAISKIFLLACKMELYMFHPAFQRLFYLANELEIIKFNVDSEYEKHLKTFIDALNMYGSFTPEMKLLGETLQMLWMDNKIIARQNLTDNLTGVLNRRGFFDSIKSISYFAQRNDLTTGILMIDIDNFKQINDLYGHTTGDHILRHVAETLKNSKRTSDIVGRYGGEEFIIYLSSVDPDKLFHVAEKIRDSVKNSKNEFGIPVTISIGAASRLFGRNVEREVDDLIKSADSCLYTSKKEGKNKTTVCSN